MDFDQYKKSFRKLTAQEITDGCRGEHTDADDARICVINREFDQAFDFIREYPRSVTFFGSARFTEENKHYQKARQIADRIVKELDYTIITGGGPGIMEAGNRGAQEANGTSIGLGIQLPHEQIINEYVTDQLDFYYFFSRKVALSYSAEAYVFFPGGFGTLDEFFELATLVQTKKIDPVPLILVGSEYWNNVDHLIRETLLQQHETISPEDLDIYTITDDEEVVLDIIKKASVRDGARS